MRKLSLLIFVSMLFASMYAQQINGPGVGSGFNTPAYAGETYDYQVIGLDQSKNISWTITNGTTSQQASGVGVRNISIKWNANATEGKIKVTGTWAAGGGAATISETLQVQKKTGGNPGGGDPGGGTNPPVVEVTNLAINVSGELKSYNTFACNISCNISPANTKYTVEWVVNNAGEQMTATGTPVSFRPKRTGQTTIKATLTAGNKKFETTKTVNIADGTLFVPNLTGINGPTKIGVANTAYFKPKPDYSEFSNIKYDWELRYYKLYETKTGYAVNFTFREATFYVLFCTATNTKTGQSGSRANLTIEVTSSAYRSMEVTDNQYEVLNVPDAVIVTQTVNNQEISIVKSNKSISYQIHNLLTGVLFDKGTVQDGGGIDTSRLPKGMYVLTLNDGTKIETHKMAIR